ncbi:Dyp-type peroxidase [Tsukamurella sp. 8F]|uniref:Dyp-type peroxidase n=1 Tax=unclassified Tsukamurella TaxID=2633480 RepID=UPI0023B93F98|nr:MULTISPECIES: Dyp-type peroxidase [unclassified Tsukamurella]MDF0528591.1 Dyp-type peroxidase [Tsukamurella sp. 8J]MDF0585553.1 Dyp-type peroxidase [Tsukamurella sp. 8F]
MTDASALPQPQDVTRPLTRSAAFLVLTINDGEEAMRTARSVVAGTGDLIKDVRIRATHGSFSCNVGIGHRVWDALTRKPAPRELAAFTEVKGAQHVAVATPGDLLFHLRADSMDLIVEFEKLLLEAFGDAVTAVDDVAGFRYFDTRDMLEFVDGTANAIGTDALHDTIVGQEDPAHAGGSYVITQKYLHDLGSWRSQPTQVQEAVIGRTKFDNVELPDAEADQQKAHKTLCTVTDADGEHDILRDNMPFATPGKGEYGTFFIGYSRHLWVMQEMLQRMFVGAPPPLHDRILDYSTAVTGCTFFVPSLPFLAGLDG